MNKPSAIFITSDYIRFCLTLSVWGANAVNRTPFSKICKTFSNFISLVSLSPSICSKLARKQCKQKTYHFNELKSVNQCTENNLDVSLNIPFPSCLAREIKSLRGVSVIFLVAETCLGFVLSGLFFSALFLLNIFTLI